VEIMFRLAFVVLISGLLGSVTAASAASKADQKFIKAAIEGNLAEVEMGKLAQQKGQSDDVKSYGQMLVQDHQANNQKAEQLANEIGVSPPTAPSSKAKADYGKLARLSGPAFDREFAKMMVADHKKDIRMFKKEARKSNDPLAQYANDTLPTLQKHLEAAEKLERGKTASH
jgi:putative membrane protein